VSNFATAGQFIYDTDFNVAITPLSLPSLPPPQYGLAYMGAINGFSGSALGIVFDTSTSNVVQVYNDAPVQGAPSFIKQDLVVMGANDSNATTVNGYALTRANIAWTVTSSGLAPLVSSTNLPGSPLDLQLITLAGLTLNFSDGSFLTFKGLSITAAPVPVPAALPLLFSALVGLFGLRRLRR
jgi:hypothetical protein